MEATIAAMTRLGRRPVRVRAELPGHVVNRLQAALWREAYDLVGRGRDLGGRPRPRGRLRTRAALGAARARSPPSTCPAGRAACARARAPRTADGRLVGRPRRARPDARTAATGWSTACGEEFDGRERERARSPRPRAARAAGHQGPAGTRSAGRERAVKDQGLGSWPRRRARMTPGKPALVQDGVTTTYADLDRATTRLAHGLRARGVGPRRPGRVPRSELGRAGDRDVRHRSARRGVRPGQHPAGRRRNWRTSSSTAVPAAAGRGRAGRRGRADAGGRPGR